MNLIKKVKSSQFLVDSIYSLFGSAISKGLALLAGVFIARWLGKDIFGEFGIIKNTLVSFTILSTLGLGYTSTKFVANNLKSNNLKSIVNQVIFFTIIFSTLIGGLLFVFSDYVAINILNSKSLEKHIQVLSVIIVVNAINNTQIGVIAGLGKFKELAKINIVLGIITFIITIGLTYFYMLSGAIYSLLVISILNVLINYIFINKKLNELKVYSESTNKLKTSTILKISFPVAMQEATYSLSSWISTLLVVNFYSYSVLGMYNAAIQWNAVILIIPAILRNVILSHLSKNNSDKDQYNKILKQTILINLICTIIPCFIVCFSSNYIEEMYGETYQGLSYLISIGVFLSVILGISNVYTQAYMSQNRNWEMFFIRLLREVSIPICFYLFYIQNYSNGAMAMLISCFIINLFFLIIIIFMYKKLNKNYV
ncbi:oligosaccharide flippase family protein [Empedobacter falsenii]